MGIEFGGIQGRYKTCFNLGDGAGMRGSRGVADQLDYYKQRTVASISRI